VVEGKCGEVGRIIEVALSLILSHELHELTRIVISKSFSMKMLINSALQAEK
jgi:hypothetical protein